MMEAMDRESTMVPWSDLPKELVEKISKCLDNHIDILRIRAVCSSWRSSLAPNFKNFPSLPLIKLPIPDMIHGYPEESEFYLIESSVYLFQLSHSPHTGWLVKIVKKLDGKLLILNPLTDVPIEVFPDNMPKKLNLLDFRVSQVCKSYHVQRVLRSHDLEYDVGSFFSKILLIWSDHTNHFSLLAIGIRDQLFCLKTGDENWTTLRDDRSKIVDIIVYKGNFYAVDRYGETIKYDPSSFNESNVSSTIKIYDSNKVSSSLFYEWGSMKRLVESGGELFLVDMFLDIDVKRELRGHGPSWCNPMEIKIHRLDEERHEWIAVHTLGDRIFVAGDDCCFSVSSLDCGGQCRGNCIYYENGGIIVDILGELPSKYYDDDFEDDLCCGCCSFSDDYGPVPADGGVKLSSNNGKIDKNDKQQHIQYSPTSGVRGKTDKIDHGSKSSGGLSEELKVRYKGLHGHHTGIFTLQDGKLGSLLSFLEYADIFWPPPSWLYTEDQAASSDAHN